LLKQKVMGIDERRENEREKKPPETEGANR
jgi:hypothetical protein